MVRLRLRIDGMVSPESGPYEVKWIRSSGQLSYRTEVTLADRSGCRKVPLFAQKEPVVGRKTKDGGSRAFGAEAKPPPKGQKLRNTRTRDPSSFEVCAIRETDVPPHCRSYVG